MSKETELEIKEHWENGLTVGEIAKKLSISIYDVGGCLGRLGYLTVVRNPDF